MQSDGQSILLAKIYSLYSVICRFDRVAISFTKMLWHFLIFLETNNLVSRKEVKHSFVTLRQYWDTVERNRSSQSCVKSKDRDAEKLNRPSQCFENQTAAVTSASHHRETGCASIDFQHKRREAKRKQVSCID